MGSVQLIEVIWVIEMTVGLAFSAWNVLDSYRDKQKIALMRNGLKVAATKTANASFRTELIRSIQLVLLLSIGIYAMTLPPSPPENSTAATLFTAVFLVFGAALMANTILITVARIEILRELESHDRSS